MFIQVKNTEEVAFLKDMTRLKVYKMIWNYITIDTTIYSVQCNAEAECYIRLKYKVYTKE
jgi:hypothetical protein